MCDLPAKTNSTLIMPAAEYKETVVQLTTNQIIQLTQNVLKGRLLLNRLPPGDEQGRLRGGERHVQASLVAYRETLAGGENQNSTAQRVAQENALETFARETGIWFDLFPPQDRFYLDAGAENITYTNDDAWVLKINDHYLHSTPLEFLDRLAIHNHLFPEAPYTVLGFARNPARGNAFSTILRQPFIIAERGLEYPEVQEYMSKLGFEDMGKTYVNDTYIIDDLHPGNILLTPRGNIVVIDEVAALNTADEDFDGTQTYGQLLPNGFAACLSLGQG